MDIAQTYFRCLFFLANITICTYKLFTYVNKNLQTIETDMENFLSATNPGDGPRAQIYRFFFFWGGGGQTQPLRKKGWFHPIFTWFLGPPCIAASSKWAFDHPNRGHLTPARVTSNTQKVYCESPVTLEKIRGITTPLRILLDLLEVFQTWPGLDPNTWSFQGLSDLLGESKVTLKKLVAETS